MISNLLKTFLCWIFAFCVCADPKTDLAIFLSHHHNSETPSVELQLLDVRLGRPYTKTKERLTELYGKPKSWTTPIVFDMFLLDKKTESILIISPNERDSTLIGAIQVSGTHPIGGLNFFADINLGDPEKEILLKFPRAEADPVLKDGYRHYNIPLSNYSIEAKNGKVASFRIQDKYTMTFGKGGNSISLSKNLTMIAAKQGLLSAPIDIDKLAEFTADSLRPYCQSRYPLRLAAGGSAYIDINLFKNGVESPISAVFLLDTGCSETTISLKLCQKINCKDLRPMLLNPQLGKMTSGRTIGIGDKHIILDKFNVLSREVFSFKKIDGILGGDALFAFPLFINFKQGYLCFPSLPISQVAHVLQFKKLHAQYDSLIFWADFYANGQLLKRGLLDSGSDVTALLKNDIAHLKLIELDKVASRMNAKGVYQTPMYGPVILGWPVFGITRKLDEITQEPDNEFPIIGMDFLRHYILGLDLKSDIFYLGE